jgi:hypothetical protein
MVELELLAICWAAMKFASCIDCLPLKLFEIWTDHAPLIPILSKYTLQEIENKCLQQLRTKLDNLQFPAMWVKGTDNKEANVFSRKDHIINDNDSNVSTTMITTVDLFKGSHLPIGRDL